ncbi:MAG: methyltransferase [Gammaproteobacteria bacterium]|jgi:16S rRNA (cytidine1402-2'-O)-methyltransferase|nr:methyltransferase [Gammaproteobacteria bacterium]
MKNHDTRGTLYVIATPIGNLKDITFRAIEVLKTVAWIAAEDTRHSSALMKQYGINTPLKSFHEHNEHQRLQDIENALLQGQDIAIISDAGTPLISDPGYILVQNLSEKGFKISPLPGPCAAIAALSCSGLPTENFLFKGFLPAKTAGRCAQLETCQQETATVVFYEAPHRLLDTLEDMIKVFGENRFAVIAREITKTFEQFQRGSLASLLAYFKTHEEQCRGEIVICIAGAPAKKTSEIDAEKILKLLLTELPVKKAAAVAAEITGLRKNELYQLALKLGTA